MPTVAQACQICWKLASLTAIVHGVRRFYQNNELPYLRLVPLQVSLISSRRSFNTSARNILRLAGQPSAASIVTFLDALPAAWCYVALHPLFERAATRRRYPEWCSAFAFLVWYGISGWILTLDEQSLHLHEPESPDEF